jgi:hypothetical protein
MAFTKSTTSITLTNPTFFGAIEVLGKTLTKVVILGFTKV